MILELAVNGATNAEIDILLNGRVELNALTSDQLIAMIERKLKDHGIKKVIPDDDLLRETYLAFHASNELRDIYKEAESNFKATKIAVPANLKQRVRAILAKHDDLRWDDAVQIVIDKTQLDRGRSEKQKARKESGDFSGGGEGEDEP